MVTILPPWFTRKVPAIEVLAPRFIAAFIVTLLNGIPPVVVTVAVPAKTTVPVPPVNVAEPLANVEALAIVNTPPAVITIPPPLVRDVFTDKVPAAPKVKLLPERMVNVLGLFATALFAVTEFAIVTATEAGGTEPPNQVVPVPQSVEALEIQPKKVNAAEALPEVIVLVTTIVAPEAAWATTAVIVVEFTTVML